MGMGQNPIPLVNIKIAFKWMFIPLKMVCIGIDPYPYIDPGLGPLMNKFLLRTSCSEFDCNALPTFLKLCSGS